MNPAFLHILAHCAFAVYLSGCGTSGQAAKLPHESAHWTEIGMADGAATGERAAWEWWNGKIAEYDILFAAEIARSDTIIDPPRAYYADQAVLFTSPSEAVVEEEVILLSRGQLAPDGVPGFAARLRVAVPSRRPSSLEEIDQRPPGKYRKAYALGWTAAYTRALQERVVVLDQWVQDRYAIFRADWLTRRGDVRPSSVVREEMPVYADPTRKVGARKRLVLVGGEFYED